MYEWGKINFNPDWKLVDIYSGNINWKSFSKIYDYAKSRIIALNWYRISADTAFDNNRFVNFY